MKIIRANIEHLDLVSPLFDLYRQFYMQPPAIERCRAYLERRLTNHESIVFLAVDDEYQAAGFTQLYSTFCSVDLIDRLVLYDLYVRSEYRKRGVATLLMNEATDFAKKNSYKRLSLETAVDNLPGQSLYEKEGWERDNDFYTYHLSV